VARPPQPCIFCGVVDGSHEHVIPEWISKQLGVKEFLSAEGAFISPHRTRRKQDISFASYRSQCFCDACNNHFKHLEDAVIPLLVPMARGRSVSLGPESQQLLALWADKTATALIAADETFVDVLPEAHRTAVRQGRVAAETWVALFPWEGGPVIGTASGEVKTGSALAKRRDAYMAFLTFARIGFCVIGFGAALEPDERVAGELPSICQLWPPMHRLINWPPPNAIDNRVFPTLMSFVPIARRG
jgi:hypothetical protein